MITSPATIEERFTGLLQHVMVCLSGPRRGCLTLPTLVQPPSLPAFGCRWAQAPPVRELSDERRSFPPRHPKTKSNPLDAHLE